MPNFSSRVEFAFLSLCTIISMIMSNHSTIHITWTILYAEISVHSRLDTICENYPLPKLHVEPLFQQIPSTVDFTLLSNLSAHSSCYFTLWHNPVFPSYIKYMVCYVSYNMLLLFSISNSTFKNT